VSVPRIVLVEDSTQLAGAVARELQADYGFPVTRACDVDDLRAQLGRGLDVDVLVTDLLFEHVNRAFAARSEAGQVSLTSGRLLESGLAAVRLMQRRHPGVGVVVWTSGEQNRRLHLLFAEQELGVRCFCSKSSESGRSDELRNAVEAAADGEPYADAMLNPYLSPPGALSVGCNLLSEPAKRGIWRAIALGADTRRRIEHLTGYSARTVGNKIPEMYDDLRRLDPGLPADAKPFIEIVRYATSTREFFLDEAVRELYP
jgi:DNA-binding NarL/FixJ family response regulator